VDPLQSPNFPRSASVSRQVFVFLQMNRPIHAMEIMAICDDMENRVSTFDVKVLVAINGMPCIGFAKKTTN
jgi:hypothetical protein